MGNRAHFIDWAQAPNGDVLGGAAVSICEQHTTTLIPAASVFKYDDDDPVNPTVETHTNPFLTASDGEYEFFLADYDRVTVRINKDGYTEQVFHADVIKNPAVGITIRDNGVAEIQRPNLNFIGFTVNDDPANNETEIVAAAGVTDHGALTGLGDDDHPQYHNDTRGDVRYYTKTLGDARYQAKSEKGAAGGYAGLNTTQTFTEDQTIEAGNQWKVGNSGSALLTTGTDVILGGYNWTYNGASYVRVLADNDASRLIAEATGDLVLHTASDAGNTVGSAISWSEKFRISKASVLSLRGPTFGVLRTIQIVEGTPEGVVTASIGSLALRADGAAGTIAYVKNSGSGNTGWGPLT